MPAETAAAIQAVRVASPDVRRGMISAALEDGRDGRRTLAQRVLVAAALQVHFVRLAALLTRKI